MAESKDEEEARKAVELARTMKGVAYLLITIYVLIMCSLGFILGVNTVLFLAIAIILFILLTIPTAFILDRKINKLLGIQEQWSRIKKEEVRGALPNL